MEAFFRRIFSCFVFALIGLNATPLPAVEPEIVEWLPVETKSSFPDAAWLKSIQTEGGQFLDGT